MTIVNNFINSLINNANIVLFVIILIAVAIYVIKKGKKGIYATALYLVTVAEEEWGSNTGKIKFAEVISTIKKTYPIISLFIKEDKLKDIIEEALLEMKQILARKQAEENETVQTSVEGVKPLDVELMTGNKE